MGGVKTLYKGLIVLGLGTALIGGTLIYGWDQFKRAFSEFRTSYHTSQAHKHEMAGNPEKAIEHYTEAIEEAEERGEPPSADDYQDRGDARAVSGDIEEALEDYRKVDELREGQRLPTKSDLEKIIESIKDSEDLREDEEQRDYSGILNQIEDKFESGDMQGAIDDLNNLLEDDPENIDLLMRRGNYNLMTAMHYSGDYNYHDLAVSLFSDALRDFNKVVDLDPLYASAYNNRAEARAFLVKEDYAFADRLTRLAATDTAVSNSIWDAGVAVALDPTNPSFYQTLGDLWEFSGRYDYEFVSVANANVCWTEMLNNFNELLMLSLEQFSNGGEAPSPDIPCKLGHAHAMLGHKQECETYRQECIDNSLNRTEEGPSFPMHYWCPLVEGSR